MGVVPILKHVKEEPAWATDKKFWVISNIILFKTLIHVSLRKNYRIKPFQIQSNIVYISK